MENSQTLARLNLHSRYSSAIRYFEERKTVNNAGYNELSVYCRALASASRIRDAFDCANTLERRLYEYVTSGRADNYTSQQRESGATMIPLLNIFSDLTTEFEFPFAHAWLEVDFIRIRYYLAIGDFEKAKALSYKQLEEHEALGRSIGHRLYRNIAASTLPLYENEDFAEEISLVDEFNLALSLSHGGEKDRQKALDIANQMAASERRFVKEAAVKLFFALNEYRRAMDVANNLGEYYKGRDLAVADAVPDVASGAVSLLLGDPVRAMADLLFAGTTMSMQFDQEKVWESQGYKAVEQVADGFRESKIAYETGQLEKALVGYEALLSNPMIHEWKEVLSTIHHDLAAVKDARGDDSAAIRHLYAAIDVIESRRANFSLSAERMGFVSDKQEVYLDLVEILARQGRHADAWEVAERAKARTLVELLADQKRFAGFERSEVIEDHLNELDKSEWGGVDLEHFRSVSASEGNAAEIVRAPRGLSRIAKEIQETEPATASLVAVVPPEAETMQRHLGRDETLVEYFGGGDRFFIIVADSSRVHVMSMDGNGLATDVQAFRADLQYPDGSGRGVRRVGQPVSDAGPTGPGERLAKRIWLPVAQHIRTEHVTIVPHGPLHYLPFSALPIDDDRLLIDAHSVRLLPSASVLGLLARGSQSDQGALILGNPDLGDPELDLPFAQLEATSLGQMLPGSRVLIRGEATETAVKLLAGKFRLVHLATHGVFDPNSPLQSRLLLAQDGSNDGNLTVAELYRTRLESDLVVLSACETALGEVGGGDDVVGFTRGFLYSGARSIVSSLWKVDDRATSELMTKFYEQMAQHGGHRRALRNAQQDLRRTGYENPYYWAAFNVIGGT